MSPVVVGIINGTAPGLPVSIVVRVWQGNGWLGLMVGLALAINTVLAVSIGGTVRTIINRCLWRQVKGGLMNWTNIWKTALLCLLSGLVSPLFAASLFDDHSPLDIELTGPLWSVIKNKEDRDEQPFTLKSDGVALDLKVRARGNSRMRICEFPPLRFNFSKEDTPGTLFEGQDKLKLVTRCKKGDRAEADVLEEYAAYRIFSLFSDAGYRVRLVHLDYKDTDGRLKKAFDNSYGFLIEPLDQMVSRLGGELSGVPAVALGHLDEEQAALVYVFQYLIANTDWSFVKADSDDSCCHNIKLIKIGPKQFPVPYDFDLSGIVNATYAKPDPSLKIRKVWQRMYRGFCTDPDVLRGALGTISSKEGDVLDVIANLPLLTEKEKGKKIEYLEKVFRKADDQDGIIEHFEKNCHP